MKFDIFGPWTFKFWKISNIGPWDILTWKVWSLEYFRRFTSQAPAKTENYNLGPCDIFAINQMDPYLLLLQTNTKPDPTPTHPVA